MQYQHMDIMRPKNILLRTPSIKRSQSWVTFLVKCLKDTNKKQTCNKNIQTTYKTIL